MCSVMITDLLNCTEQELQAQIAYLEGTPVSGIAQRLRTRQYILKKGSVLTLTQLGALKTEFGKIGPLVSNATDGEKKFCVAELLPILRNNPGVDDGLLTKIDAFVEKDMRGEIEYNVTILDQGNDLVIKDGNKRTVAFFERRKGASNDAIVFPVFVVQRGSHGA